MEGLSLGSAAARIRETSAPPEPLLGVILRARCTAGSLRGMWPVRCVTLVTLHSCCLGFPTCWAEMGLLAESARVLMRQGLAGAGALGKAVCHGFLSGGGAGGRARAHHTPPLPSSSGSDSSVAALKGLTSGLPQGDSAAVAKEGLGPGLEGWAGASLDSAGSARLSPDTRKISVCAEDPHS